MTIHVLIPVFNRLHHTQRVVESLRAQTIAEQVRTVVINDGSTDGTAAYLAAQPDVTELRGDGKLWWGGSIEKGLQHVLPEAGENDYILFVNNDTWFGPDYVETLMRVSRAHGDAAVGSVVHEEDREPPLVSIGPKININRLAVWDIFAELSPEERRHPRTTYEVDALSGRGTLYPISLFRRWGTMRTVLLPHYFSDYEIGMRFARHGTPLLVSSEAVVFSPPVYGAHASLGWWDRLFSRRSPTNLLRRTFFYMLVGSPLQRLTAPLRIVAFAVLRTHAELTRKRLGQA